MFPSLNKKFQGSICKANVYKLKQKVSRMINSCFRMFTIFEWTVSQVSHETANQTGAKRGSCIHRLQSWRRNCCHTVGSIPVLRLTYCDHWFLKQITKLDVNQIHQNLHMSQTWVRTTCEEASGKRRKVTILVVSVTYAK